MCKVNKHSGDVWETSHIKKTALGSYMHITHLHVHFCLHNIYTPLLPIVSIKRLFVSFNT